MGWFSSKKKDEVETPTTIDGRKGKPTPTRKEAELARRERIKPTLDKKAAKRRSREDRLEAENLARDRADARPANKLMRDYIDSRRFLLSEHILPLMLVILVISFLVSGNVELMQYTGYSMYLLIVLLAIEQYVHWRLFKRLADERIPDEPLKGIWYYGFNRSIGPRRIRRPMPTVNRGDQI